jgi:hypothetical protein
MRFVAVLIFLSSCLFAQDTALDAALANSGADSSEQTQVEPFGLPSQPETMPAPQANSGVSDIDIGVSLGLDVISLIWETYAVDAEVLLQKRFGIFATGYFPTGAEFFGQKQDGFRLLSGVRFHFNEGWWGYYAGAYYHYSNLSLEVPADDYKMEQKLTGLSLQIGARNKIVGPLGYNWNIGYGKALSQSLKFNGSSAPDADELESYKNGLRIHEMLQFGGHLILAF